MLCPFFLVCALAETKHTIKMKTTEFRNIFEFRMNRNDLGDHYRFALGVGWSSAT